ncbi:MAG: hypothetical protein KKH94_01010 [Candidatus Omnitrophica bacterium]|nr:hypothetical protein [Candidatus Omnitrophota bacterium]
MKDLSTLEEGALKLGFPVVLKPCFGESAMNIRRVDSKDELFKKYGSIKNLQKGYMVQEYIPGNEFTTINSFIDNKNQLNLSLSYREKTLGMRIYPAHVLAYEHLSISTIDDRMYALFKALDYRGYSNLQFKIDSRDNTPKLFDFNPRINYSAYLVMERGINAPLINYQIYNKKKIALNVAMGNYEINTICPLRELCIIIIYLWCVVVKLYYALNPVRQVNPFKNLPPLIEVAQFYRRRYFTRRKKTTSPFVKSLINDPLVGICFFISYFMIAWRRHPDDFIS